MSHTIPVLYTHFRTVFSHLWRTGNFISYLSLSLSPGKLPKASPRDQIRDEVER
jgi:hypothetical protein